MRLARFGAEKPAVSHIPSRLSVVIPAFNAARYLTAAVDSVRRQPWPDVEIIVVDDGSQDDTAKVAERLDHVVCVRQPNAGAAAARNRGVELATGEWLAFLDADDCWTDNKINVQMAHLVASGFDMVFGLADEFYSHDVPSTSGLAPPALRVPARCAGTMLIAHDTFLRAGPFPTTWRVGEFVDWYLRATELGLTGVVLPEVVLLRRLHASNSGRTAGDNRQEYLRIIKSALDRRRAAAPDRVP
jgi:glycosyltransferase involved in cell wall biosynthesis